MSRSHTCTVCGDTTVEYDDLYCAKHEAEALAEADQRKRAAALTLAQKVALGRPKPVTPAEVVEAHHKMGALGPRDANITVINNYLQEPWSAHERSDAGKRIPFDALIGGNQAEVARLVAYYREAGWDVGSHYVPTSNDYFIIFNWPRE